MTIKVHLQDLQERPITYYKPQELEHYNHVFTQRREKLITLILHLQLVKKNYSMKLFDF